MALPPPPDASPYAADWSLGAVLGGLGIIYVGEIPAEDVPDLLAHGWEWNFGYGPAPVFATAEPAPALPPPPDPVLVPPTPMPPGPLPPPANDPVFDPHTPMPVPEPTTPPEPVLPPEPIFEPNPPGTMPPIAGEPPLELPPVAPVIGIGLGEILIGIGGLLWPTPTAPPEIDSGFGIPPVSIPPPSVTLPEPTSPPIPSVAMPDYQIPTPPDVIVVTPTAPNPQAPPQTVAPPEPAPEPNPRTWPVIWPFAPPSSPPLPLAPPVPSPPPVPSMPSAPPLTSVDAPPVDSSQCETPQQTKDRRDRKRDACQRLITIRIRAHTKRVCMTDAALHEYRKAKRRLISKAKRELIGGTEKKLGLRRGTIIVTPGQAKRRLRKLVRVPTVKIPGTDIGVDINPYIRGKP